MLCALLSAALLVVVLAAASGGGAGLATSQIPVVDAHVSTVASGAPMPGSFVGLSVELPALVSYAGSTPAALNPLFIALVRALSPGARPLLRIGGRSADATWLAAPGLQLPSPGLRFQLTTNWLRVAHAVAAALDAKLILDLNMAAGDPSLARAESERMRAVIGSPYIDAFEIGNEPDVYNFFPWYRPGHGPALFARPRTYDLSDYLGEFSAWRAALGPLPIAGPAFASYSWMSHLATFLAAERGLSIVTFHQYPLWACQRNKTASNFPSIANLLKPSSSQGLAHQIAPFAAVAHAAGLPFRLDELNSAACSGRLGVSNTFAAALWSLDTLFGLAAAGVDGVNIHTLPGAAYAPFSFERRNQRWTASVRPLYYGLLAFVRAFPPGARLLSVRSPAGPVRVWATLGTDGRVRVTLINERPSTTVTVDLRIDGPASPLSAQALRAPSLLATDGVSLDGESFGASTATGALPADGGTPASIQATPYGYYRVLLPAASAIVLTR
jgi:hypothetical protein